MSWRVEVLNETVEAEIGAMPVIELAYRRMKAVVR